MKFGVLYDLRNPPQSEWFTPWPEFYAGAFEHMQEMERLGFDTISLPEHHGDPEGYNPSMPVTLTAAAMRTRRVRICSNIIQLPLPPGTPGRTTRRARHPLQRALGRRHRSGGANV